MASRIRSSLSEGESQFKAERAEKPKQRKFLKRKRPLSRQSRLRIVEAQIYRIKRDKFLREHPICQRPGCSKPSTDCHHAWGRGKYYLVESTWKALCADDHKWVHRHPNKARAIGLLH